MRPVKVISALTLVATSFRVPDKVRLISAAVNNIVTKKMTNFSCARSALESCNRGKAYLPIVNAIQRTRKELRQTSRDAPRPSIQEFFPAQSRSSTSSFWIPKLTTFDVRTRNSCLNESGHEDLTCVDQAYMNLEKSLCGCYRHCDDLPACFLTATSRSNQSVMVQPFGIW